MVYILAIMKPNQILQLKQHAKSLEAAFTYYVTHHDDEAAKTNLEYYMEITGETRVDALLNREAFVGESLIFRNENSLCTMDSFPLAGTYS